MEEYKKEQVRNRLTLDELEEKEWENRYSKWYKERSPEKWTWKEAETETFIRTRSTDLRYFNSFFFYTNNLTERPIAIFIFVPDHLTL